MASSLVLMSFRLGHPQSHHQVQLYCAAYARFRALSKVLQLTEGGPAIQNALASERSGQLCTALRHQHGPGSTPDQDVFSSNMIHGN